MLPKDLPRTIGRYEVIDRVGHGGMGVVYQARDPHIGRLVAVKLLNVSDEGVYERFLQEARSAGQLKHRNIVTIYDYGEFDNTPFIVMEFIEGTTLGELIRTDRTLSLPRKLELIGDLAEGLDYAHNKGVVHRDVKPANVMIDREGVLKILDFGLARVGESGLTQFGSMMGTPNYMSPEQIQGGPVDRRSDIFAVGLLFYELLSCRQAFPGASIHQVLYAITQADPTPLSELCPGLDRDLVAIVNKAIEKDASRRYDTLGAFGADVAWARTRIEGNGAGGESDLTAIIAPISRPASQGVPRPHTPRDLLARRRSETIEAHLETARRAFETGDYAAAVAAAEQAAILDPEEPRILDVLESARQRLDERQVEAWLSEAGDRVRQADLDGASQLVAKALQLDPASEAARRVRLAIDRERQQPVIDRDAVETVERARSAFAAGDHALALSRLDAFSPPHPLIARTRADLMTELLEIERRAREAEDQRRAEALAAALDRAEQALLRHAYDDALRALADAGAVDPQDRRLTSLRARVAAEREEAWTRTKKVTLTISRSVQALDASDFVLAERLADEAVALEPANAEAHALKTRVQQARARALRQVEEDRRARAAEVQRRAAEAQRLADAERARAMQASAEADAQTVIQGPPPGDGVARIEMARPAPGRVTPDAGTARAATAISTATRIWLGAAGLAAAVIAFLLFGREPVAPPPDESTGQVVAVTSVAATVATTSIPARPESPRPPATSVPATVSAETVRPRPLPPAVTSTAAADIAAVATTSIPPSPQTAAGGAPPTVPVPETTTSLSIATTSMPATTSVVIPGIERSDVDRILAAYAETFRRLDKDGVQRIYPTAPTSLKLRLDALKRDYSRCDVSFSNVQVVSSAPNEAVVRADSIEVCRRKTAQPPISTDGRHEFHLTRNPSGDWIVGDLLSR